MTDHLDAVVSDYLARLDQAAAALPYDRRVELVGEIAEHISEARAAGSAEGEAALRDLLDRLGDPAEIVAAAREDDPGDPGGPGGPGGPPGWAYQQPMTRQPGIGLEIAAIGLMTVGSLIPFLGWVVGTIMLWFSHRLRIREKLLMTLVVPGGPFIFLALTFVVTGQSCSSGSTTTSAGDTVQGPTVCSGFAFQPWLGIPLLIVSLIAPFVIGGLLLKKAAERARLEPPIPVYVSARPAGTSQWGPLEIAAVLLLSVGWFVLPAIGPIAGLVCVWVSQAWTTPEKLIATAIPMVLVLVLVLGLAAIAI